MLSSKHKVSLCVRIRNSIFGHLFCGCMPFQASSGDVSVTVEIGVHTSSSATTCVAVHTSTVVSDDWLM